MLRQLDVGTVLVVVTLSVSVVVSVVIVVTDVVVIFIDTVNVDLAVNAAIVIVVIISSSSSSSSSTSRNVECTLVGQIHDTKRAGRGRVSAVLFPKKKKRDTQSIRGCKSVAAETFFFTHSCVLLLLLRLRLLFVGLVD
jgi:hypothetical protein